MLHLDGPCNGLDHGRVVILAALLAMQVATAPAADQQPRAYVITMGPGNAPWEKYGHNMLWISMPQQQIDVAFNWGLFDFGQKNFFVNFIQGRLWYWMDGFDPEQTIAAYLEDDRTIWVQELNLSQQQVQRLWEYCRWNAEERNRFYRYDYFTDNCSTKLRDAVDTALGGQMKQRATTMPSEVSYRSETLRLTADDLPLYVALDAVLGQPTDRQLSAWEEMFIPLRMRERVNQLTVADENGHQIPLVRGERVLNVSKRPPLRDAAPNWAGWFVAVGIGIGAATAACGSAMAQATWRRAAVKWTLAVLGTLWTLVAGFAGWFFMYGWIATDHVATRQNENVLQLNPLLLPLVVLVPMALRGRIAAARMAMILSAAAGAMSLLGLALKLLPAMDQANWNIIALALPANAGLAWAMWMLDQKGRRA